MKTNFIYKIAKWILSQPNEKVTVVVKTIQPNNLLHDKKIVVTGGSSGIGFAMAKRFISEGATVIISGKNENKLLDAKRLLGDNCVPMIYDATNIKELSQFVQTCIDVAGDIPDAIICNAGISLHEGDFLNVDIDSFESQFLVNYESNYFLCKEYINKLLQKKKKRFNYHYFFRDWRYVFGCSLWDDEGWR